MPISPKATSMMFGLGVPVVIGPMCGGMDYPPAFQYLQGKATRAVERIGRRVSHLIHRLVPGKAQGAITRRRQRSDAAGAAAGHKGTRSSRSSKAARIWISGSPKQRTERILKFVSPFSADSWIGRASTFCSKHSKKSPTRAMTRFFRSPATVRCGNRCIGGPSNCILRLGFDFWDTCPASAGAEIVRDSDVFVLPSLRECGGTVLLEAMAVGVPMVATNWGGPSYYVDDSCGIRVDPSSRDGFHRRPCCGDDRTGIILRFATANGRGREAPSARVVFRLAIEGRSID